MEAWRWKLKGLPAPVENVWVAIAADDGRVVGQYAGIPVRWQHDGRVDPAMISVDTMTAPEFRRRGILTALGQAIYATWAAAGVAAVLGLPNQQWGSRTDALGWVPLFPLLWQQVRLHAEARLAARVPPPLRGPVAATGRLATAAGRRAQARRLGAAGVGRQVGPLPSGGDDLDSLWARLAPRYRSALVRDAAWVRWRFLGAPDGGYRVLLARASAAPAGYVAYRCVDTSGRRTGFVADLCVAPDDPATAAALLGAALEDLWALGAAAARAPVAPGSALSAHFATAGFRPAGGAFQLEIVPLGAGIAAAALGDPAAWLVAGGDFDVV